MAVAKRAALGPRQTVVFTTKKVGGKNVTLYSNVPAETVKLFGLKVVANAKGRDYTVNGKKVTGAEVRGSVGAGSMKLPVGKPVSKTVNGKKVTRQKYRSIPVPAGATVKDMKAFATKITTNKPTKIVTPRGVSYGLATK
jgi:hypothetical protein